MEGIINPETVALLQEKMQQEAAKGGKKPESIVPGFRQEAMYAEEAAHRKSRTLQKKKKK